MALPEVLVAYESSGTIWYLYLPTSIGTDDGIGWTFSAADGLGSVRQQLDSSRDVDSVLSYRPFGSPLEGNGGDPYGYTGEWWNSYIKLSFLRSRWYHPQDARFLSPDTIIPDYGHPPSIHQYSYVYNNAINYTDPSGHQVEPPDCEPGEICFTGTLGPYHSGYRVNLPPLKPFCEYVGLDPKTLSHIKVYASRYGVPWQIVAGVLKSEIETDTEIKDFIETWFWSVSPWPLTDLVLRFYRPDPGPGIGNVHVVPAQSVSQYFAEKYPNNPEMQLNLHNYSRKDVAFFLTIEELSIMVVSAFVRQLADYRYGSNSQPLLTSHAELSDWKLTDAAFIWHGFRYGVPGISPPGYGEGFEYPSYFQDRTVSWEMGLNRRNPIFIGTDAEISVRGAIPYLQCYLERCE